MTEAAAIDKAFAIADRYCPLRKPGQAKAPVCVLLNNGLRYEVLNGDLPKIGEDARTYQLRPLSRDAAAPFVADALADRFRAGTTPRSTEYRAGFEAMLYFKFAGGDAPECPYRVGYAQADAWLSGQDHGSEYFTATKHSGGPLYE